MKDIYARVEASMCMSYGTEHPNGREEARISREDWDAVVRALNFYADRNHWMSASEDGPQNLLVAQGDFPSLDGWLMAAAAQSPRLDG